MFLKIILSISLIVGSIDTLLIPVSKLLTKNKPHNIEVLNKDMVVWWNKHKKEWCATDDMCLHRQASLSDGLLTKEGNIKCRYHGWEYGGCGSCVHSPSSKKTVKTSLKSYDIIEKHGILWLTDNDNDIDIVETLSKDHIDTYWFFEEREISHELFIENAIDVVHFNHTHNFWPIIDRFQETIVDEDAIITQWYNESGFSVLYGPATFTFMSPYTVTFNLLGISTAIYAFPINDKNTRFVSNLYIPYKNKQHKLVLEIANFIFFPIFMKIGRALFDQDLQQMSKQNYYINKNKRKKYINFAPDKPIFLYNKWLREYKNVTEKSFL
tara:strand:- start:1710 stop:2684 length:975 start_codon:yes stop_codon:yes gene_type:complete